MIWVFIIQITDRMAIMYSGSIAELGKTEDIFNDPIHPYTKMLVDALPRVGEDVQRVGIAGRPPALKIRRQDVVLHLVVRMLRIGAAVKSRNSGK